MDAGFVELVTEDRAAAEARLCESPSLAAETPWHALVCGEAAGVEQALADGALDVRTAAGPLTAVPLVYVCFSRFAQRDSPRAPALIAIAQRLLALGADPNATFETPKYPGNPFPCLYGATGYNDNPALGRVLIDAGAKVDDDESIYHSTEHDDLACLRMLLAPRPRIHGNVLKHMLDREHLEGVRLLLDAGADPGETNDRAETSLHWAVWRDRSPAMVELLLSRGAPIDARRIDGRTAYAMAVLFGRDAVQDTLAAARADTSLSAVDRYLAACAGAAAAGRPAPTDSPPPTAADAHLLPDLANANRVAGVDGLLAAGIAIDARGEHGATALHFACWSGADGLVARLVSRGADLSIADRTFKATPPGWLIHGARFCPEARGDYAAALRELLAAGATVTALEPTGRGEVDALLRERGLLEPIS